MKKIDKLILGAFFMPFSLTFVVVVFIFLTQYLLKYMDDFVGKGLGIEVYAELIFYFAINMVPVSLPLAILLSCLMTFGNLGEHFELTALKGSGISLIRALVPVGVIVVFLAVGSFFFSNIVVPRTNLKAFSLLYDIRQKKPSLDFKEGAFYDGLPGYSVKISKKHEDGKTIGGIMIYNHSGNKGNTEVILADSGQMYTFNHDQYLALDLYNGKSFSEIVDDGNTLAPKEFVRNSFKKSKLVFSLESFGLNRTPAELFSTNRVMKPISVLEKDIDSMNAEIQTTRTHMVNNTRTFYSYQVAADSPSVAKNDSLVFKTDQKKSIIYNRAANNARGLKAYIAGSKERYGFTLKEMRYYSAEKYRKYTQACACIIMFLIGAPLGAIIKKGGFGVPVIISIGFFIVYYVTTMFGEKWAKVGVLEIQAGMWLGNCILLPVGLFFMKQARADSRIFDTDVYAIMFDKVKSFFQSKRQKKTI
jgi:lipopolysaccharide export system permease protein